MPASIGCRSRALNERLEKAERSSGRTAALNRANGTMLEGLDRESRDLRFNGRVLST